MSISEYFTHKLKDVAIAGEGLQNLNLCLRSLSKGISFRRGSRNFSKGGGLRRKILKEKCLLIHVSTRVHIKPGQICNSFSLLPFQEDCLLFLLYFITLFYFWNLKGMGGATPITHPLDPPMSLSCLSCIANGPRFTRSHLNDRLV